MMEDSNGFATGYAVGRDSGNGGGNNGNGMFGNDWAWIVILLLFGWGRNGFGGGNGGGFGGGNYCYGSACATQADLAAGFNNSAVLNSLNDIKMGQAQAINYNNQGFAGLNTALLQGFHGVDNAICNLGYQQAQCCCDTRAAIKDVGTQVAMTGAGISKEISDCCCDIEKMNMQSRFDAQAYNCNTLQAIDKLGDRIIDHLNAKENQSLRDEVQTLRLAASQANQNNFIAANQEAQTAELIRRLGLDRQVCPIPSYIVPNPNCCYQPVSFNNGCGCGCGNGGF